MENPQDVNYKKAPSTLKTCWLYLIENKLENMMDATRFYVNI